MNRAVQFPYNLVICDFVTFCKYLNFLAIPARLELATYCLEGSRPLFPPPFNYLSVHTFSTQFNKLVRSLSPTWSGHVRHISEVSRTKSVHLRVYV